MADKQKIPGRPGKTERNLKKKEKKKKQTKQKRNKHKYRAQFSRQVEGRLLTNKFRASDMIISSLVT